MEKPKSLAQVQHEVRNLPPFDYCCVAVYIGVLFYGLFIHNLIN